MNIVKWYKNRSFQFKLVIGYLVLALIPMLCVTWYSYGKTRNVLLTEAYQSAEQEAERIEKNFSTMVEPYETILEVLYVDQMLSGYLFQDYSNDSYEDMFYYIDKKLSEICLMNAGIYKICFYSNNETLPQDNYYFYSMQDLDRRECVLTFDAIGETVFCGTSGDGKAFHMNRLMNFYPQGGMKSVLSLQIENQQIQPLLETINSTDEIYLVDQKGYILAASEPEMAGLPIRTRMPEEDLEQKAQIQPEDVIQVELPIGLPPKHFAELCERYERYFKGDGKVQELCFNDKVYHLCIQNVMAFPQDYAAMMTRMMEIREIPKVVGIDIGGFTSDYLLMRSGRPDMDYCDSLEKGVITMYNDIISSINSEYDMLLEEADIDSIIKGKTQYYEEAVVQAVETMVQNFVTDLLNSIRERGIDTKSTYTVFIGGGAVLLERFLEQADRLGKHTFIRDMKANADGYDLLYRMTQAGV